MMTSDGGIYTLVGSLSGHVSVSKNQETAYWGEAGMYALIIAKLFTLITAASCFLKNSIKLDLVHILTFYTSVKRFLGEIDCVFAVQRIDSNVEFVKVSQRMMS